MTHNQTVFVIDDDPALRDSLRWLIESLQHPVKTFESAQEFLDNYEPGSSGCLLLDVRLPGMSGLQLQKKLNEMQADFPVIIITGHGDVPMAVRALQAGAMHFLEKPFRDQELLDCVQEALELDASNRDQFQGFLYTIQPRPYRKTDTPRIRNHERHRAGQHQQSDRRESRHQCQDRGSAPHPGDE